MPRSPRSALLAVACLLLFPSLASAGPVTVAGNQVAYSGGDEANAVTATFDGSTVALRDAAVDVTAEAPCVVDPGDAHRATCPISGGGESPFASVQVLLGDGADAFAVGTVTGGSLAATVYGDGDADTITGGAGMDTLLGGPGADDLDGAGDGDRVDGGSGADTLDGGPHPQPGAQDVLDYASHGQAVTVDVAAGTGGGAEDGTGDTFTGFEQFRGGQGDDTITGTDAPDVLSGAGGEDTIRGQGGGDVVVGDEMWVASTARPADTLDGGAGEDLLLGGPGPDAIDGGADRDMVSYRDHAFTAFYEPGSGESADVQVDLGDGLDLDGGSLDDATVPVERRDALAGIESVTGGPGDDTLAGDGGSNSLLGGAANVMLAPGSGNDGGDDLLTGGGGVDDLHGGEGYPQPGGDGADRFRAGAGNDLVVAADGAVDLEIDCGADSDQYTADPADPPAEGCETQSTAGGGGDPPPPPSAGTPGQVSLQAGAVMYVSRNGIANDVTVTVATGPNRVIVDDDAAGAALTAGPGCDAVENDPTRVACAYPGAYPGAVVLSLGDQDDASDVDIGTLPVGGRVNGGSGDDTLTFAGPQSPMMLDGGPGDDVLTAGAGNQSFQGGTGSDTISGGPGVDEIAYHDPDRAAGVHVDLSDPGRDGGTDDAPDGGTGPSTNTDVLSGIESIIGSRHNDTLIGDGESNRIVGLGGQDILDGRGGPDHVDGGVGIFGLLVSNAGTDGIDQVAGGSGDDRLLGGPGADEFDGGPGVDALSYDEPGRSGGVEVHLDPTPAEERLQGGAEDVNPDAEGGPRRDLLASIENLEGSAGDDTLEGNAATNHMSGAEGADTVRGGGGADALEGGIDEAADRLEGEAGDDALYANAFFASDGMNYVLRADGGDRIIGGDGQDTMSYVRRASGVTVTAGAGSDDDGEANEHDTVDGDVEHLVGSSAADTLTAVPGDVNSRLDGGPGSDTLNAGDGDDRLNGGVGAHGYESGDDVLHAGPGNDVLVGGQGGSQTPGDGRDTFDAGTGSDLVSARDGREDVVSCTGGEADVAQLDPVDGTAQTTGCAGANAPGPPPASASGTPQSGGSVSTDDGQPGTTPDQGAETGVQTPVGGAVTIDQSPRVTFTPPDSGVQMVPLQIQIEAPQASAGDPLRLRFTIDVSLVPAETDLSRLRIYRDGTRVQPCAGGAAATTASPDPCHLPPQRVAGNDVEVVVLSAHASQWNLGVAPAATTVPGNNGNGNGSGSGNTGNAGNGNTDTGTTSGGGAGGGGSATTVPNAGTVPGPTLLPAAGGDRRAPVVRLAGAASVKATALVRSGVQVAVTCSEAARTKATLTLDARTAKRAKIKGALGTASGACAPGRTARLTVKVARKHAARLRRLRSGSLRLAVVSTDAAGNSATSGRAIRLTR